MFYHFMIIETNLDSGLLPLGTGQEVIQLARYVHNHIEINLYIENENTRVVPFFKSLLKVRIEKFEGDHSPEINRFEDNQGKRVVNIGDDHQPKGDINPVDDYEVMGDVDA
uniref:Uncharacterized protein n=1 Tax=Lactuca sativa TaxID=4236 RepID=A0A9R1XSX7_LACSA|nr:hypothetical protein LSAT_V11C100040370 [Lactuca sativa]